MVNKNKNFIKKLFHYTYKSIASYGRGDLGIINNLIRWIIYLTTISQIGAIIGTAIIGFKKQGYFGPFSNILGLGYTQQGLIFELSITLILIINFLIVVHSRLEYLIKKDLGIY